MIKKLLLSFLAILIVCVAVAFTYHPNYGEGHGPKAQQSHLGYQANSVLSNYFSKPEGVPDAFSGFFPLETGHDALLTRLAMIESAEHSLDLQYYIFSNDETSQLIVWRLYEAAERGVKVRLLIDDMQSRKDSDIAYLDGHPNIDVRLFNPHQFRALRMLSWITDSERLNRRMHNKSMTADGVASVVGGRNIGNEYFSFRSSVEFGDFDVLLNGPVVEETAEQFDLYWNSEHSVPMSWIQKSKRIPIAEDVTRWREASRIEHKFTSDEYNFATLPLYKKIKDNQIALNWGSARLLFDSPTKVDDGDSQLITGLTEVLEGVESSMTLISPYFVPTEAGTRALVEASLRGKRIVILTNSLASNDVFAVHGWYAKYREALVEAGIELWEMKAHASVEHQWSVTGSSRSSLHAKVMMLDDKKLFVGSMNMDPRSARLNTEMAVMFNTPAYVESAQSTFFDELSKSAYQVTMDGGEMRWIDHENQRSFETEPDSGLLLRTGAWLSGLLPIESWL
ncbi:phospholipase D family protein [Enterovibrio calviensis]|uniref:phospholipase D family protein n=1 Tax=Enterovibrio calviensis TaxID=91359 RepID=UPI00048646A0|nr:phospholipase D family protein [Enterovibrio calviensis]